MCMTTTHTGSLTFRGHAPHNVPLVPLPLRLILFQTVISFTFSRGGVEGHVSKGLSPFERGRRLGWFCVKVCAQTRVWMKEVSHSVITPLWCNPCSSGCTTKQIYQIYTTILVSEKFKKRSYTCHCFMSEKLASL